MAEQKHLLGNSPINNFEEDLFNFKHYAEKVKKIIQLNSSNTEPITIGIYGKWGEGKTSFLNLLKHKIEHFDKDENGKEYLIYDFNPWRYSNEDEMLFDFFDGIAKKFYVNKETSIQEVGKFISKYSKYLKAIKISATVGIPKLFNKKVEFDVNKVFEALGEDLTGEKISLDFFKDKINETIKKANFKVVVFIDDIDRLDKNEIYTILKLIKLNANFNNFIFVITLDSEHVAKAIKDRYGNDDEDGKLFLEKIINIPIHLPKIEEEDLKFYFEKKLDDVAKKLGLKQEKEEEIRSIKQDLQLNLFKSPREIIRVLNSFFIGAFGFENEINLRDLFWIEFLKIKDENLYDEIKKYSRSSELQVFFEGQSEIINFNDDFSQQQKSIYVKEPNGTRKAFIEKYPKSNFILDDLFPLNLEKSDLDNNSFDLNLNINSVNHFNKYFSFHTENKLKNTTIENIKFHVIEEDEENLLIELTNLFADEKLYYKAVYKLESLIKFYKDDKDVHNRDFFYLFLIRHIELVPKTTEDIFGIDTKIRIVEMLGTILNSTNDEHNKNEKLSIEISKNLDVNILCHFVRKFRVEQSKFKIDMEKLISDKAKEIFDFDNPVYMNPKDSVKMIMHYWNLHDSPDFKKHVSESLTKIIRIKKLIRNFPGFWNNSIYGGLTKENYDYMKKLIDVDFLFSKVKEFDNTLITKIDIQNYPRIDESDETTEDENLNQFIYWYLLEDNNKKMLLISK
jgi:hypothetical protein